MSKWLILFGVFFSIQSFAITINKKIFILSDSLETVNGQKMPYITFNESNMFTQSNPIIEIQIGDSLSLWVVNHDSITHNFGIKNSNLLTQIIPSGDSVLIGERFLTIGTYIYYDPLDFPKNSYLGLSGMIVVKNHNHASFYWNIKEHITDWNQTLVTNGSVNWSTYYPKYFTINGVSNPNINLNTDARIVGTVGDTLILNISNTGQSIHSLHFHGYHGVILFSSKNSNHQGREKDTFPIYPMETLTLMIVPDKEGEYPIHDHNLVAITGNNIYPNGMFTTILITP